MAVNLSPETTARGGRPCGQEPQSRPGRGDPRSVADYVLAPFELEEDLGALVSRAADAVETIARDGVEAAQQRFNQTK